MGEASRWLSRLLPALRWRRQVTRRTLRADLAAGVVGAVVVLPQGIAFATLAGLPPEFGLYAAMVPAGEFPGGIELGEERGNRFVRLLGPRTMVSLNGSPIGMSSATLFTLSTISS